MGLLQKVSDGDLAPEKKEQPAPDTQMVQKKSNSVGLLKKSLIVSQNDKLDFFEFLNKYQFSLCAVLRLERDAYCVYKSYGLDAKSICHSYSTLDFWNGTITQKCQPSSYKAGTTQILPFNQFFSQNILEKLECLNIIKLEDDSIVFFATPKDYSFSQELSADIQATDFDKDPEPDYQSIDFKDLELVGHSVFLYSIDLSEAIGSFIIENWNQTPDDRLYHAISNEIYYNLVKFLAAPNAVSMTGIGKYKLAYCAPEEIPIELLYNHLRYHIKNILEKHSELLSIDFSKNAQSVSEIQSFLQAE